MSYVLRRPVLPLRYFGGHFAQHGLMVAEAPVPSHGPLRCSIILSAVRPSVPPLMLDLIIPLLSGL